MSGTDSTAQPSDERQSNRGRRPQVRKTARAPFPLITATEGPRRLTPLRTAELDTSVPSAGGGRGFTYEWESTAAQLEEDIHNVTVGVSASFTHHQTVPAAQWVIDHHLGLIPNIIVLDDSGQQLFAEIRHPSDQTTVVVHSAPYSGTAFLRP